MKKFWVLASMGSIYLLLSACTPALSAGESGSILMQPYENEEIGIRSIVPSGWAEVGPGQFVRGSTPEDQTVLVVASVPSMSILELRDLAASQLELDPLPESFDSYQTPFLEWDLHTVTLDQPEIAGIKLDIALAAGNKAAFGVVFVTIQSDYDAERSMFDTLWTHTLDAFEPIIQK